MNPGCTGQRNLPWADLALPSHSRQAGGSLPDRPQSHSPKRPRSPGGHPASLLYNHMASQGEGGYSFLPSCGFYEFGHQGDFIQVTFPRSHSPPPSVQPDRHKPPAFVISDPLFPLCPSLKFLNPSPPSVFILLGDHNPPALQISSAISGVQPVPSCYSYS